MMELAWLGLFVWLLGLCVGSFLNVVIYRLPLGLSVSQPRRSFCPKCSAPIAAFDNIPVLSWLLLRGRCRRCRAPIGLQYPLVEALCGLAFVLAFVLLFSPLRGAAPAELARDWPLLLAWLTLTAALVACAAMDIVSYTVDTRVTDAAMYAGLVLYAVWPRGRELANAIDPALGAAALAAGAVSVWLTWRAMVLADGAEADAPLLDPPEPERGRTVAPSVALAVVLLAILVSVSLWLLGVVGYAELPLRTEAVLAGLLILFVSIVMAGSRRRAADHEVKAAIDAEQPQARAMVVAEARWLALPLAAGAAAYALVVLVPAVGDAWGRALGWIAPFGAAPLAGVATSAIGALVAAAAGWLLRIVFTLAFGREAFGVGDIFILAAAGACAGWPIALLGLLCAIGLSLAGWLLGLLFKSTAIIPFGPWLALGFLVALWIEVPAGRFLAVYRDDVLIAWRERPEMVLIAGAVLAGGAVVAVLLAKLLRRVLERPA